MNKKIVALAIIIVTAIVCSFSVYVFFSQPSIQVTYVDVYFTAPRGWGLSFGITNNYNSPITNVGILVSGGYNDVQEFLVPPGQAQEFSTRLANDHSIAVLGGNGEPCTVKLTFTFADGKYTSYSQTVIPRV